MARKHRPEEIIGKLREAQIVSAQGGAVADACRSHVSLSCGNFRRSAFASFLPGCVIRARKMPRRWPAFTRFLEDGRGPAALQPDFNPIEKALSKLKAILRRASKQTVSGPRDLIGRLVEILPPA